MDKLPEELKIEIPQELELGEYSNFMSIIHSNEEFCFDFSVSIPPTNRLKLICRLRCSPANAKRFLVALQENVSKFEQRFGPIILENTVLLSKEKLVQ